MPPPTITTILSLVILAGALAVPLAEQEIITAPKPGDEYVFVQSTSSGARPIARKDKSADQERPFETSHKFPASLTFALNDDEPEPKKPQKREAAKSLAPAPAGAIKLDVKQLLAMYEPVLKTSTTTSAPKVRASRRTTTTTTAPSASTTTKRTRTRTGSGRRSKKEAIADPEPEVTSIAPVLTTGAAAPKSIDDDDVPLVAAGSEKQRSRIQIKKGPNGQEYEYEYVYYYYDEDDDKPKEKVSNSHDGPAKHDAPKKAKPEVNEVVPSTGKGRPRGRQLDSGETVGEDRLPANTRFPPRSRNLNTTPLPEEEVKTTKARGRGRPSTEATTVAPSESDSVSDETQGSRGRTRANVRRPSLELVDNASFNTHSNQAGAGTSGSSGPTFPADLPAGPDPASKKPSQETPTPETPESNTSAEEVTTVMSAMDKVALDLYAILQGTQKLSGEDLDTNSTEEGSTEETTTLEAVTTEVLETTTPTTTTTTTTTTTEAPTTTTTEAAPIGRGRYKTRGGIGRKTTHGTTESSSAAEVKPKSKFNRPSFGRPRPGAAARTTPEPAAEAEVGKEEAKPVSHSRPTLSRNRFGGTRTRARTTAAPSETSEESSGSSSSSTSRPAFTRPRSSFNLRSRSRTTAAPAETDSSAAADSEPASSSPEAGSSTTVRTRRIGTANGGSVRPLRPGPRINIGGRSRLSTTTTTTESAVEDHHVTGDEAPEASPEEDTASSAAPVDSSPLSRLRTKHHRPSVQVQAKPKASGSAPVQVRRVNPLLGRRRPGQAEASSTTSGETEATTPSAPSSAASESSESGSEDTEAPAPSTTTEEPRGLNKLLAGRRRLVKPAAAAH